jgi:hypothetical protein
MKVLHSRQGSEIRFDDHRECLLSDLGCMVFVWHPSFLVSERRLRCMGTLEEPVDHRSE